MATKKDLQSEVKRLNDKYCKNTKNHLVINEAYGGYEVMLTGKPDKRSKPKVVKTPYGNRYKAQKTRGMSGAVGVEKQYHGTANETIKALYKAENRGWLQSTIKFYEKQK